MTAAPILPVVLSTATGPQNISAENIIAGIERLIENASRIDPNNNRLWSFTAKKIERKTGIIEIELHIEMHICARKTSLGAVIVWPDVNLCDPDTRSLAERIFEQMRDNWNERWTLVEDPIDMGSLISKAELAAREFFDRETFGNRAAGT